MKDQIYKNSVESIDNLKLFVDEIDDLIIMLREDIIIYSNDSVERLFGYTKFEIIGRSLFEFISEAAMPDAIQRYQRRLAGEELPHLFDSEVVCKDGSTKPVEVSTRPIEYEDQTAFVLVVRDSSQRKQAEQALRESESRFKALAENMKDGMVVDIDGRCAWVNRAFADIIGYDIEEALEKTIEDLAHPDALPEIYERLRRRENGEVLSGFHETILVRKDRSHVDVEASVKPIIFDGQDARQVIIRDITQRKQAEKALSQSEERYRLLFDSSDEPIMLVDEDGIFQTMNSKAASYFGKKPADLIGKRMGDLFPSEIARRQLKSIRDVIESDRSAVIENKTIINNVERTFMTSIVPLGPQFGSQKTAQLIARDITESRRRQLRDRIRLELHESLRTAKSVDQCLGLGCQAIFDAELFRRSVFTLHNKDRQITNTGYVGVDRKLIESAKKAAPPSKELTAKIMQKRFRLSNSYFVPTEAGLGLDSTSRYIPQKSKALMTTGAWESGDELFVPIFRSKKQIAGWLSADTPFDKMRPDLETVHFLEQIADIIYFKIRDLLNVKRILAEDQALKEKNIALREVLGHIEAEKIELRKAVAGQVEQAILPALDKAVRKGGAINGSYIDIARTHLMQLVSQSSGSTHIYSKLSRREAEICQLIEAGNTNKEMAQLLAISISTVQKHRESIRRKFGLKNKSENLAVFLKKLNYP